MSRVGQISIARPGFPLQLKFSTGKLKQVLEQDAQPGDHITLYPGDYTTWYNETSDYDQGTEIEIEEGISVTILPGAKVDYYEGSSETFRDENYTHEGETFDSKDGQGDKNHPLSLKPESARAKRYNTPNFTGHIENIGDMNLASEWAFETDLEKLRTTFNNVINQEEAFGVTTDNQTQTPNIELGKTLEFREKANVNISTESYGSGNVGVNIEFDKNSIIQVDAGRNLTSINDGGEVTIDHEVIVPDGTSENSGTKFIQSLFFKNGHVKTVESAEVATINEREPRSNEGEDGDIWFVKERDFILNLFLSTNTPSQFDGEEGDLWFVDESLTNEFRKAGDFFISDATPSQNNGENGSVWLDVQSWTGTDFEVKQIEEITHKEQSPTSSNGSDGDIQSTTTRIV